MYGRYTHNLTWQEIVDLYRLTLPEEPPERLRPSYNAAPTHAMPIIRPVKDGRELVMAGWGLVPFWLKPENLGKHTKSMINARSDSIRIKPAYREPFAWRRCLVPATGWYEWPKIKGKKAPYHLCPKASPFAFAGVWDVWKGDGQAAITSFSIVTTEPAPTLAKYHNRAPLILVESQFDDWMRGPPELAADMMKPYAGAIEAWEVSADVGNVKNNRPELMERVGLL